MNTSHTPVSFCFDVADEFGIFDIELQFDVYYDRGMIGADDVDGSRIEIEQVELVGANFAGGSIDQREQLQESAHLTEAMRFTLGDVREFIRSRPDGDDLIARMQDACFADFCKHESRREDDAESRRQADKDAA